MYTVVCLVRIVTSLNFGETSIQNVYLKGSVEYEYDQIIVVDFSEDARRHGALYPARYNEMSMYKIGCRKE